jgi:hypothetical protein
MDADLRWTQITGKKTPDLARFQALVAAELLREQT